MKNRFLSLIIVVCTTLLLSFGMTVNAFSQSESVLWQIGTADQSGKEFALFEAASYKKFPSKFQNGGILYEVGKTKTSDIPYFLPGPSDAWAGNRQGQLIVHFGIDQMENDCAATLKINLLEVHPAFPPVLQIEVGDFKTTVKTPKGSSQDYLDDRKTTSKGLSVEVDIPAGKLQKGDNVLIIRNTSGSWIAFDNILLTTGKPVKLGKTNDKITVLNAET
ncbi:MAG: hypothetical protein LBN71_05930, partial [Tannerella sp.]|nr:hypothetical protein [Tannerella sp.]